MQEKASFGEEVNCMNHLLMPRSQMMQASYGSMVYGFKLDLRKSYGFVVYCICVHKLQGVRTAFYEYYYIGIAGQPHGDRKTTVTPKSH